MAQSSDTHSTYLITQHTWGDSNLYLRRADDRLVLTIEHRAAPSHTGLPLALCARGDALALAIVEATPTRPLPPPSPIGKLTAVLAQMDRPLTLAELRQACRMRTASVCQALAALTAQGRLHKTGGGYQLVSSEAVSPDSFPAPAYHRAGHGNG